MLAEHRQLRAGVAARIPAEPEILAAADDDDTDFQPHQMLRPSEAAVRFGLAVNTVRLLCRSTAGSTAIGAGDGLPGLQGLAIEPSGAPRLGEPAALAAAADQPYFPAKLSGLLRLRRRLGQCESPRVITVDKNPAYPAQSSN